MWTLLAVALSACAYYVSIGLGEFWPAAWIAPIPVLLVAFRSSWRTAALAAFAAYFLGSLNLFAFFGKDSACPVAGGRVGRDCADLRCSGARGSICGAASAGLGQRVRLPRRLDFV